MSQETHQVSYTSVTNELLSDETVATAAQAAPTIEAAPVTETDLSAGAKAADTDHSASDDIPSDEEPPAEKPLEDGTYIISSSSKAMAVVDVANGKVQQDANVQVWHSNGTSAQQWDIAYDSSSEDGNTHYYTIAKHGSNYVLDLKGGASATRGANVQLGKKNGSDSQLWSVEKVAENQYNSISKIMGLVLDLANGKTANRTNVQV